jgi:predicted acetyltransferase
VPILANAYPALGLHNPEARERVEKRYTELQESEPSVNIYGCYREDTLVGGMMLHDFKMHLLSTDIFAGGVGMVAVDLPYKKEKVARDMIRFYLNHYRERGAVLAMLYPFRPDFYKAMGFGNGVKMHQYNVTPDSLPQGPSKSAVRLLSAADAEAVLLCHNALAKCTHGMTYRRLDEVTSWFTNPENRVAGVWRDGHLGGYMCFTFARAHDNNLGLNDLHVRECVYHEPDDFRQLMTFLRSQSDQVRRIVLTTPDHDFHHFLLDPRDGSNNVLPPVVHQSNVSGVGLMYRVLDVRGIFTQLHHHDFAGASFTLKLTVADTLCPEHR